MLNQLHTDVWELDQPLKSSGLPIGHRMTVVRLRTGELWVHSPVKFDETIARELNALGPVTHFVAPSRLHDLYWADWFIHYPRATFACAPGVTQDHPNLRFQQVLTVPESWESDFSKLFIAGMPKVNEFVFLHHPSQTLIVADLLFNLDVRQHNLLGRLLLRLDGIYGCVSCSRIFRFMVKDRAAFKQSIQELLGWDFDRIILGHGTIVETNGQQAARNAFDWLLPS